MNTIVAKYLTVIIFIVLGLFCLGSYVSPPLALFSGLIFSFVFNTPFQNFSKTASKYLLQISIVGLGFGMHLRDSLQSGSDGMLFTLFSVAGVLIAGLVIGKWLGVAKISAYLIATGTAICGGSAISAVGPIVKADEREMSVSLATIFILNAIGLFLFPVLGHWLGLSQHQFGIWAAIAIHDTSSVVGAGASFGEEALRVATTVKLTRALWIVPLSVFTALYFKTKGEKIFIPWFILFFIVAMLLNSGSVLPTTVTDNIVLISRRILTFTLFLIGVGLSRENVKTAGVRPLMLGVFLWIFIALISLFFIYFLES